MSTYIKLLCLVAVAIAQAAVPVSMIAKHETTYSDGVAYRFRTMPVDPIDVWRGRYVWLSVEANSAPIPEGEHLEPAQSVFVSLGEDSEGFTELVGVSANRPASGDYIKATVTYVDRSNDAVMVDLPIDRYYMDEDLAPEAERVYREQSTRSERDAYVVVRVRAGHAVIEELYIEGVPIADYVRDQLDKEQ